MEKEKRKNNIVVFGLEENEKNLWELVDRVKRIIEETRVYIESHEIKKTHRIGMKSNKTRPIVVCISSIWKIHLIMRIKNNLQANIKDDFSRN